MKKRGICKSAEIAGARAEMVADSRILQNVHQAST
jgi:hypothetical protein